MPPIVPLPLPCSNLVSARSRVGSVYDLVRELIRHTEGVVMAYEVSGGLLLSASAPITLPQDYLDCVRLLTDRCELGDRSLLLHGGLLLTVPLQMTVVARILTWHTIRRGPLVSTVREVLHWDTHPLPPSPRSPFRLVDGAVGGITAPTSHDLSLQVVWLNDEVLQSDHYLPLYLSKLFTCCRRVLLGPCVEARSRHCAFFLRFEVDPSLLDWADPVPQDGLSGGPSLDPARSSRYPLLHHSLGRGAVLKYVTALLRSTLCAESPLITEHVFGNANLMAGLRGEEATTPVSRVRGSGCKRWREDVQVEDVRSVVADVCVTPVRCCGISVPGHGAGAGSRHSPVPRQGERTSPPRTNSATQNTAPRGMFADLTRMVRMSSALLRRLRHAERSNLSGPRPPTTGTCRGLTDKEFELSGQCKSQDYCAHPKDNCTRLEEDCPLSVEDCAISLAREDICALRVLAQVECRFLLAVLRSDTVVLVDQHAASERVNLEMLEDMYQRRELICTLLLPQSVEVRGSLLDDYLRGGMAQSDGWAVEGYEVVGVPRLVVGGQHLDPRDILECAEHRMGGGVGPPPVLFSKMQSTACRASVKFGDYLSLEAAAELVRGLGGCRLPFQCAHARPTVYPMKMFQSRCSF
jgi:hypothetical protein